MMKKSLMLFLAFIMVVTSVTGAPHRYTHHRTRHPGYTSPRGSAGGTLRTGPAPLGPAPAATVRPRPISKAAARAAAREARANARAAARLAAAQAAAPANTTANTPSPRRFIPIAYAFGALAVGAVIAGAAAHHKTHSINGNNP